MVWEHKIMLCNHHTMENYVSNKLEASYLDHAHSTTLPMITEQPQMSDECLLLKATASKQARPDLLWSQTFY